MNTKSFLFLIAVIVLASYGSSTNPSAMEATITVVAP